MLLLATALGWYSWQLTPSFTQALAQLGTFLLVLIGVTLIANAKKLSLALYRNCFLAVCGVLSGLLSLELLLWLSGFPSVPPPSELNPPYLRREHRSGEFEYLLTTNRFGIRYSDFDPALRTPHERRVLVLGDSFVEGWGVKDSERFTDHLEAVGGETRFINGGLSGTGFLEQFRAFKRLDQIYKPDCTLIAVYANDLQETPAELPEYLFVDSRPRSFAWFLPRLRTHLNLLWRQTDPARSFEFPGGIHRTLLRHAGVTEGWPTRAAIDHWLKTLPDDALEEAETRTIEPFMLLVGLFTPDYWLTALDLTGSLAPAKADSSRRVLSELIAAAKAEQRQVVAIYLPSYFQYDPRSFGSDVPWVMGGTKLSTQWLNGETTFQKFLRQEFESRSVPFYDLTEDLRAEETVKPGMVAFRRDGHLTPHGHRVVADLLQRWLAAHNFCAPTVGAVTGPS
jgi:hypothetical protein